MSRSRGKSACGMARHIWEPRRKRKLQARRLRPAPGARARPHDRCRHTVICAQQGSRPGSIRAGGSNLPIALAAANVFDVFRVRLAAPTMSICRFAPSGNRLCPCLRALRRAAGLPNQWDLVAFAAILAVLTAIAQSYHGISAPLPAPNEPPVSLDYCELPYYAFRTALRCLPRSPPRSSLPSPMRR